MNADLIDLLNHGTPKSTTIGKQLLRFFSMLKEVLYKWDFIDLQYRIVLKSVRSICQAILQSFLD